MRKKILINIIHSEKGYSDQFSFLCNLYSEIEGCIYTRYTSKNDALIHVSKTQNIKLFWIKTAVNIIRLARRKKENDFIVVEHLTGYTLLLISLFSFFLCIKNIKLGVGLYSDNWGYFKERVWRKEDKYCKLKLVERFNYFRTWAYRTLADEIFIKISDFILTNSINQYNRLESLKPVHLINNNIINKVIDYKNDERNIDILLVAVFMPGKGVGGFLQAINMFPSNISLKIVIIGRIHKYNKKWAKKILDKYTDKRNFEFLNEISFRELDKFYMNTRLLVLPTYSEGMARVLFEAYEYNCNLLASDILPNKYLVEKGFPMQLFKAGDTTDMYNKMKEIINKEHSEKRKVEYFSEENIRKELFNFFNQSI